jgi:ring-1,2-phenylacetyl-CoA epoxidase subunit PaaE
MKKYTLKVEAIKKETTDSLTICFKQPSLRKIKYLSGQYLTLSFRINGRKYARPYSFSCAPSVDSFLEVTIKRIPGGKVSNYVHDNINTGDLIEVFEPLGDFVYTPNEDDQEIYFWGVGSGISPLLSIIKDLLANYPRLKIHLIYGNKNKESTIFLEILNQLIALHSSVFKVTHFYSQSQIENNSPDVFQGRINRHFILGLLKNSPFNTKHYICGPDGLKHTIRESLDELNISLNTIFSEDFELIKDPKDFEDITSQEVKINFQENDTVVVVEKGKSVLEAALDAGIDLFYSCQTGNCNTCKGKLKTGELKMIGLTKERDDLEEDDYLLCCSYPITDNIYIQI